MQPFSIRHGYKSIRTQLQIDNIDARLKTKIWNLFYTAYLEETTGDTDFHTKDPLYRDIWTDFLINPVNKCPDLPSGYKSSIQYYFDELNWFEIYDFLEFVANRDPFEERAKRFIKNCNEILSKELSGWHFAGSYMVPITSEIEINEIEGSLQSPSQVEKHIKQALDHLSNKTNPDFRNSIKESISAVEALCKIITKNPKATLSSAINEMEMKQIIKLHPDLRDALKKIYSWTNDDEGIRHALKDDSSLDIEDAKYMLIACSAFVNYLKAKAIKSGIPLN